MKRESNPAARFCVAIRREKVPEERKVKTWAKTETGIAFAIHGSYLIQVLPPNIGFDEVPHGTRDVLMQNVTYTKDRVQMDAIAIRIYDGPVKRDYIMQDMDAPTNYGELHFLCGYLFRWLDEPEFVDKVWKEMVTRG